MHGAVVGKVISLKLHGVVLHWKVWFSFMKKWGKGILERKNKQIMHICTNNPFQFSLFEDFLVQLKILLEILVGTFSFFKIASYSDWWALLVLYNKEYIYRSCPQYSCHSTGIEPLDIYIIQGMLRFHFYLKGAYDLFLHTC